MTAHENYIETVHAVGRGELDDDLQDLATAIGYRLKALGVEAKVLPQALMYDLLAMPVEEYEGRSEVLGIRTMTGDLIVGIYPRGGTYLTISDLFEV